MKAVFVFYLLLYTYGTLICSTLLALSVQLVRERRIEREDSLSPLALALIDAYFLLNLIALFLPYRGIEWWRIHMLASAAMIAMQPLSMALFTLWVKPTGARRQLLRIAVVSTCAGAVPLCLLALLVTFGAFGSQAGFVGERLDLGLSLLGPATATFIVATVNQPGGTAAWLKTASMQRWNRGMLVITILGTGLFTAYFAQLVQFGELLGFIFLLPASFPLVLVAVYTYYRLPFAFFDVVVKSGSFSLVLVFLMMGYYAFTLPLFENSPVLSWGLPWSYGVTALPIGLAIPWIYRKVESWVDRNWLGRELPAAEIVCDFSAGLKGTTSENELTRAAGEQLSKIFQARVEIIPTNMAEGAASDVAAGRETEWPIRIDGETRSVIHLGPRRHALPYFSSDLKLLSSLAEVYASTLENLRLQERRKEQERKEQELLLLASRAELQALRAWINPHFLFNALNAIAGLIPREPTLAEDTIERLAEIFRYVLKGSEKEWVRIGDEIDFIRSYLEVERARFGARLQTSIRVENAVKDVEIPTMIVQPLVENALKHGVSAVRGSCKVEVASFQHGDRVHIEVRDNGPGLGQGVLDPGSSFDGSRGHGLKNVSLRLRGYFGLEADVKAERDTVNHCTVVSIEMPLAASRQRAKETSG